MKDMFEGLKITEIINRKEFDAWIEKFMQMPKAKTLIQDPATGSIYEVDTDKLFMPVIGLPAPAAIIEEFRTSQFKPIYGIALPKAYLNCIDASMYDTTQIFRWHYSPAERQRMLRKARQCRSNAKKAIDSQNYRRAGYWSSYYIRWTEKADRIKP